MGNVKTLAEWSPDPAAYVNLNQFALFPRDAIAPEQVPESARQRFLDKHAGEYVEELKERAAIEGHTQEWIDAESAQALRVAILRHNRQVIMQINQAAAFIRELKGRLIQTEEQAAALGIQVAPVEPAPEVVVEGEKIG